MSVTPLHNILTGPLAAVHGSLPMIELPGENVLHRTFDQAIAQILKTAGLFRRGILPVIPLDGHLVEMIPAKFITWATECFVPFKIQRKRDGTEVEQLHDMTEQHAKIVLADTNFIMAMPAISRICPCPVPIINDAGSLILCTPGYDPSSGTYVFEGFLQPKPPDPAKPPIPNLLPSGGYFDDSMTLAKAFWYLQDLHRPFPFFDWCGEAIIPPVGHLLHAYDPVTGDHRRYQHSRSLAVHIGAMLSVFASGCVPREASRMGFVYNANQQRTGKTLLVKLTVTPVYGPFKGQTWRENDESLVKLLDSEILAASSYICFDNVRGLIESQPLESVLTSPTWTGRHLGRTEMFTAENNAVLFITGNNVSVGSDIGHRTLWCELFCEEADAQARVIDGPILDDVWLNNTANRYRILSALWAIVRHWDHAGRPLATGKPRLGFETWGSLIGGMVEFAGFGDMLATPKLDNAGNTEGDHLASLVRYLWKTAASDYTYQEIVHFCWENGWFPWNFRGREEAAILRIGGPAIMTFKLNDEGNSRMGKLLGRHSRERGSVHSIPEPQGKPVKVRFSSHGEGRGKRFMVKRV